MISYEARRRLMATYDTMSTATRKSKADIDRYDAMLDSVTKEIQAAGPDHFHVDITRKDQPLGSLDERIFYNQPRGFIFGKPKFIHPAPHMFMAPMNDMVITP